MKRINSIFLLIVFTVVSGLSAKSFAQQARDIYEIRTFHFDNPEQEKQVDQYLEMAYLPALERAGIKHTGVFKPIKQDSATRKTVVLIPYADPEEFFSIPGILEKDPIYLDKGSAYINAPFDKPPYQRIAATILQGFEGMPRYKESLLTNPGPERVYELRSYESSTEKLYKNKVAMFNNGEIEIFDRLGFNPIFYGEVIAGPNMPNLVYMTTFSDMESRDRHWEAFGKDPAWKSLSAMEEYKNNMNHAEILLLTPTAYSKL